MGPIDTKPHCFRIRFYRKDGNLKIPQKEKNIVCESSEAYFNVTHIIER